MYSIQGHGKHLIQVNDALLTVYINLCIPVLLIFDSERLSIAFIHFKYQWNILTYATKLTFHPTDTCNAIYD